jgi:hypothetical protein
MTQRIRSVLLAGISPVFVVNTAEYLALVDEARDRSQAGRWSAVVSRWQNLKPRTIARDK